MFIIVALEVFVAVTVVVAIVGLVLNAAKLLFAGPTANGVADPIK